ncbi:hypothetical protein EBT31_22410 [bacterium]|jgi:hypothetical protein|nr:hypothetical protein [bacterium]
MARPKKTIEAKVAEVTAEEVGTFDPVPVKSEKELIIDWLRSGQMAMFERNTRWLADRIAEGDHLK